MTGRVYSDHVSYQKGRIFLLGCLYLTPQQLLHVLQLPRDVVLVDMDHYHLVAFQDHMCVPHLRRVRQLHRPQSKMMQPIDFKDDPILNKKINEFA